MSPSFLYALGSRIKHGIAQPPDGSVARIMGVILLEIGLVKWAQYLGSTCLRINACITVCLELKTQKCVHFL